MTKLNNEQLLLFDKLLYRQLNHKLVDSKSVNYIPYSICWESIHNNKKDIDIRKYTKGKLVVNQYNINEVFLFVRKYIMRYYNISPFVLNKRGMKHALKYVLSIISLYSSKDEFTPNNIDFPLVELSFNKYIPEHLDNWDTQRVIIYSDEINTEVKIMNNQIAQ